MGQGFHWRFGMRKRGRGSRKKEERQTKVKGGCGSFNLIFSSTGPMRIKTRAWLRCIAITSIVLLFIYSPSFMILYHAPSSTLFIPSSSSPLCNSYDGHQMMKIAPSKDTSVWLMAYIPDMAYQYPFVQSPLSYFFAILIYNNTMLKKQRK